ncbi:hypothetical protein [Streptomyces sp. SM12]|uniref:hypothetical protein n=1 Tax=Streptomyces sp. SM12 TaxID=1071602 RepID=UPI000CD53847|nr:hypothetical protein [Streptomyces sp. SM12]
MMMTPEEEIDALERERHRYSNTFANTDPADVTTRAHLQHEMDWRTRRIQQLQEQDQPLGCLTVAALRLAAAGALWGAWAVDPTWATVALALLALLFGFFSLA